MLNLSRLCWLVGAIVVATALAGARSVFASEPPPRTYPERFDTPKDAAERDAQCTVLRARSTRLRAAMQDGSIVSRLNWVRVYERRAERFLEEQCGDVDERGLPLSAMAERSGNVVGSPSSSAEAESEHHE